MNTTSKEYFPALTGLRAVAAFLVLLHHYNPFSVKLIGVKLHNLADETHIGVTIFFVLSGFLISYRYLGEQRINLRTYFANRFARIYPMYFLLTTLSFGAFYRFNAADISTLLLHYLLNISFLRGVFEEYVYTGIAQGWSLTVEEMFYFSAPLAFWLIRRSVHWLWLLPLSLTILGVVLVLVCQKQAWHGFFGSFDFLFQFTYLGRALEFYVGVALAWWLRQPGSRTVPRLLTYYGLAGILLCLAALSLLHGPKEGEYGVMKPAGMITNNVMLPLIGIGPLLWGLIREDTGVRRLLCSSPMILLGKSSYIFYLIHMGVLQRLVQERIDNTMLTSLVIYGISILLYYRLEEPLNQWLRRALDHPTSRLMSKAIVS